MNTTACKRLFSLGCVAHTDGAVLQGDVGERVRILQETGQDALAAITATNHGLDEQAVDMCEQGGFGEHDRL